MRRNTRKLRLSGGTPSNSASLGRDQLVLPTGFIKALLLCFAACIAYAQIGNRLDSNPLNTGLPYVLGAGDELSFRVANAEEFNDKPLLVAPDGSLDLPIVGLVHPGGKTVEQFKAELVDQLRKYIIKPEADISVVRFRGGDVTMLGAFVSPGVYKLQGRHTLAESLASAGGLKPNASPQLRISRNKDQGAIEVPGARLDPSGLKYVFDLDINSTLPNGQHLAGIFVLKPFDLVTASTQQPIYVSGEVAKVGSINLEDKPSLSLIQVLYASGGITRNASTHIKIYRPIPNSSSKKEIDADLQKVIKGQQTDIQLVSQDIVIVPRSAGHIAAEKLLTMAALVAGGAAVAAANR